MDTQSILCCLRTILKQSSVNNFYVISKNNFDDIVYSQKTIIICNTSSKLPGEHWVAFHVYCYKGELTAEYFDSFAQPLEYYGIVPPFSISRTMFRAVQSEYSETCALHCLYFSYLKVKLLTIHEIGLRYRENKNKNDQIVRKFYKYVSSKNKNPSINSCCRKYLYKL
jgi:hypothetical protein